MTNKQTSCNRCGCCCNEGGPALHGPDLEKIRSGKIPLSALITLRKGELAHNPVTGLLAAITAELVKLKGVGRAWSCCYFDQNEKRCTVYEHRPQACTVLKCWEPEALLAMVENDTLTRFDILLDDDPIRSRIHDHDHHFPCPDMAGLLAIAPKISVVTKSVLQKLVNEDLQFRVGVVKEFKLNLSDELFYFGRPVFQLLQPLGARLTENSAGVRLHWG
jgi:Fe-S-cluster containining protein